MTSQVTSYDWLKESKASWSSIRLFILWLRASTFKLTWESRSGMALVLISLIISMSHWILYFKFKISLLSSCCLIFTKYVYFSIDDWWLISGYYLIPINGAWIGASAYASYFLRFLATSRSWSFWIADSLVLQVLLGVFSMQDSSCSYEIAV